MRMKKKITLVAIIIVLVAIVSCVITNCSNNKLDQEYQKAYADINSVDSAPADITSDDGDSKKELLINSLIGKTFEYEDEFLPGRPQTYTFNTKEYLTVAYWDTAASGEVYMTGVDSCRYKFSDALDIIKIYYPDSANQELTFQKDGANLILNGAVYTPSSKTVTVD